jgi:hypothetical protein
MRGIANVIVIGVDIASTSNLSTTFYHVLV